MTLACPTCGSEFPHIRDLANKCDVPGCGCVETARKGTIVPLDGKTYYACSTCSPRLATESANTLFAITP